MKNNFSIWVAQNFFKEEQEKVDNRKHAHKNNHTVLTDAKVESKDKSHFFLLP